LFSSAEFCWGPQPKLEKETKLKTKKREDGREERRDERKKERAKRKENLGIFHINSQTHKIGIDTL